MLQIGNDPQTSNNYSRAARIALVLIVGLYAAARLWRLTDSCLWFDEIFSVHAARHTWGGLVRFAAADIIHPPLFYALLKVWIAAGGESLLWLRLFPVLTSIACVVPLFLLARELRLSAFETNLALLIASVSGYLIKYSQELRMYSLLLLLSLFSLWLFARLVKGTDDRARMRGTLIALFVVNLLAVYTHYYGWLIVAAEALFAIARRRNFLWKFLITTTLLAVCYVPWVYALASAGAEQGRGVEQNLGWVERPRAIELPSFYALLHDPFYFRQSTDEAAQMRWGVWATILIYALPLALLAWGLWRRRREDTREEAKVYGQLFFFALAPAVFAFALSWALPQSVWGTRHLIIVAGPYLLLVAAALARVRPAWLKATLLVLMSCWIVWGALVVWARGGRAYIWCAWEHLAADVRRAEDASARGVYVYAFEDLSAYHLWYALDVAGDERFRVAVVKGVRGIAEDPAYFLPRAFEGVRVVDQSALEGEHFWLTFRGAGWDESRPPLKNLKERGYRFVEVREFRAQGQTAFLVSVTR